MCRNIKTLYNFDPPATTDEIRASATQYVRKLSGFTHPSKENSIAFEQAINKIEIITQELLNNLVTSAPSKNRETEAAKAKLRTARRFNVT